MYHDKPKPGRGYVGFCLMAIFMVLGLAVWITVMLPRDQHLWTGILVVVWAVYALLLLVIRAAYHTEYVVTAEDIEIRSGVFFHARIPRQNILEARPIRFIPRVLGWGIWSKGCCNRMTNGLALKTTDGKVYVSPTNIQRFLAEIGFDAE